jgi:hypothetical protein
LVDELVEEGVGKAGTTALAARMSMKPSDLAGGSPLFSK